MISFSELAHGCHEAANPTRTDARAAIVANEARAHVGIYSDEVSSLYRATMFQVPIHDEGW
jgi:hypothetical protein